MDLYGTLDLKSNPMDSSHFGTRKAEVLNSLIMKITANENDTNDILRCRVVRTWEKGYT